MTQRCLFWLNATACWLQKGRRHGDVLRDLRNSQRMPPHAWRENLEIVATSFSVERKNVDG